MTDQEGEPRRKPPLLRALVFVLRRLVRIFFRDIEVTGVDEVPRDRGGLLVAWHPNALIDPALLASEFPQLLAFGARHALFDWPVVGRIMRALGCVPIYRSMDEHSMSDEERRAHNEKSLRALAQRIADGAYSALFPEGISHDEPYLAPLKTGAARLYYQARSLQAPGEAPPAIIPVGLYYDDKELFRSSALVWFYAPIELPPELDVVPDENEPEAVARARARELTETIEAALDNVVHSTEDWETHRLLNRVRKLIRAERAKRAAATIGKPNIEERTLAFARVQRAYCDLSSSWPEGIAAIRARVADYDAKLRALGLEDHELDAAPSAGGVRLLILTLLQFLFVFLLLPPLVLLGYVVNGPTALGVLALSRRLNERPKYTASYKILIGAVAFPLTWIAAGILGAWAAGQLSSVFRAIPDTPVVAGAVVAVLSAIGGLHAIRYQTAARIALKNLRVRFRRHCNKGLISAMVAERAGLFDQLMELAEGLDLPGRVSIEGVVSRGD